MQDLTRDDLARFLALWPRAYVPAALLTASTLKVLDTLRQLANEGGMLIVLDEPTGTEAEAVAAPPPAPIIVTDDDIPF